VVDEPHSGRWPTRCASTARRWTPAPLSRTCARPGNETDEAFDRHIAAAGRKDVNLFDDDGTRLFVLQKIHEDRKFDNAMAGCLSWQAYLDAVKTGAKPRNAELFVPYRIR
jgi:hypothetical protein